MEIITIRFTREAKNSLHTNFYKIYNTIINIKTKNNLLKSFTRIGIDSAWNNHGS